MWENVIPVKIAVPRKEERARNKLLHISKRGDEKDEQAVNGCRCIG